MGLETASIAHEGNWKRKECIRAKVNTVSWEEKIPELLEHLGIAGHHLQNVKLGPGVVGRNSSIAWALEVVMLAGVIAGAYLHSTLLVAGSLLGAVIVALAVTFGICISENRIPPPPSWKERIFSPTTDRCNS